MPIKTGKSKETIGKNIATEIKSGKARDQSIAIAFSKAEQSKDKKKKK